MNKDRLMDGWMDGGTVERMDKQTMEPKNGWKFEWIDGQTLEQYSDRERDRWIDRRINGWRDGQTD